MADIMEWLRQVNGMDEPAHTCDDEQNGGGTGECLACGARDCPSGEALHYHHDGCPSCDMEE